MQKPNLHGRMVSFIFENHNTIYKSDIGSLFFIGTETFSEEYAIIDGVGVVFSLFAIGALMPIMTQILKLSDLTITAICVLSSFTGNITIMLAENYKLLYLAQFFRMFMDVTTVGIRSALSKLVSSNDTGKVRTAYSNIYTSATYLGRN